MAINRFEVILPGKGMVDCFYKYDDRDRILSVGVRIDGWPDEVDICKDLHEILMEKAIEHHKQVRDARSFKARAQGGNGYLS